MSVREPFIYTEDQTPKKRNLLDGPTTTPDYLSSGTSVSVVDETEGEGGRIFLLPQSDRKRGVTLGVSLHGLYSLLILGR